MRDRRLRVFLKETRSVTAVEFAMIGPLFFIILMAIFIMGVAQFWQLTLDDAVRNATRQVQIGAIKSGSAFVTGVCNEFGLASVDCASGLQYDVQGALLFNSILPATVNSTGTLSQTGFTQAVAGNIMLAQVAYKIPFTIPLLPNSMITLNGTPAIISAVATSAEP